MKATDILHSGKLYDPNNGEILKEQAKRLKKLRSFNKVFNIGKRTKMLKDMFDEFGEGCYIEPPFYANWAGKHIRFGKNVYANFNLTCVDDTYITVGDYTMIGPNVTITTAAHPVLPSLREKAYQYNAPVNIGRNCWLGAGVTVLAGVTIGDNTVVGAGSVVNKDLPANVVAVGVPCKVLREIGEKDKIYYFKDNKIDEDLI